MGPEVGFKLEAVWFYRLALLSTASDSGMKCLLDGLQATMVIRIMTMGAHPTAKLPLRDKIPVVSRQKPYSPT